jgi:hypothetical protein
MLNSSNTIGKLLSYGLRRTEINPYKILHHKGLQTSATVLAATKSLSGLFAMPPVCKLSPQF